MAQVVAVVPLQAQVVPQAVLVPVQDQPQVQVLLRPTIPEPAEVAAVQHQPAVLVDQA
jgi:hypothetical protein